MADEPNRAKDSDTPFRESGSGDSYNPQGSWGAERRRDNPSGGDVTGAEGAPSGAGDGGYGPEGDYAGKAGDPNADILGQVGGDVDPLTKEAQTLGKPKPGRATNQ